MSRRGEGYTVGPRNLLARWLASRASASRAHRAAQRYWENCSNTFLAAPAFYEKQEALLRAEILPRVGQADRVLDLGCGNGRFTFVLAENAGQVLALDLSELLIAEARSAAQARGVTNVRFDRQDLLQFQPTEKFSLVSCMGVTPTLVDQSAFTRLVDLVTSAVAPDGCLLLKASLSTVAGGELVSTPNYTTRYRNEHAYLAAFESRGMHVEFESEMHRWANDVRVARMFLLRRHPKSTRDQRRPE